jgi:cytochrome c oxidase subunit IV
MKGAARWIVIIVILVVLIGLGSGVFMTGMAWGRGAPASIRCLMSGYFPGGWLGMA